MKIYRESLKNVISVGAVIILIIVFCGYFHRKIGDLLAVSWRLTVGENKRVATPQDRWEYLQAHPDKLKLAMIGDWENSNRNNRPRQNVMSVAINKLNQQGGIGGREIVPEWMDIHNSSDELHEYVEKVARDPSYYAIIGPSTSGQLLSVKPLLLTYKLLTIAPAVSNTNATRAGEPPYIFLPNSSDAQDVEALRLWAQESKRNNFILINENQTFSVGYAQHIERVFFENDIMIAARTFFNPTDNVSYFMDELKNYADFFTVQHALIINFSAVPKTYERLAKWMFANTQGSVFSYKLLPGNFTDDELKRMYSIVYFKKSDKMKFYANELAAIPGALQDAFAPAAYQTPYLLADACHRAKSLHQDDVIATLRHQKLKGPYSYFKFSEERFEQDPVIRIVSVYQLRQDWSAILKNQGHMIASEKTPDAEKK